MTNFDFEKLEKEISSESFETNYNLYKNLGGMLKSINNIITDLFPNVKMVLEKKFDDDKVHYHFKLLEVNSPLEFFKMKKVLSALLERIKKSIANPNLPMTTDELLKVIEKAIL